MFQVQGFSVDGEWFRTWLTQAEGFGGLRTLRKKKGFETIFRERINRPNPTNKKRLFKSPSPKGKAVPSAGTTNEPKQGAFNRKINEPSKGRDNRKQAQSSKPSRQTTQRSKQSKPKQPPPPACDLLQPGATRGTASSALFEVEMVRRAVWRESTRQHKANAVVKSLSQTALGVGMKYTCCDKSTCPQKHPPRLYKEKE